MALSLHIQLFVILDHPPEHPNHWAVKDRNSGHVYLADSLEAARATVKELRPGAIRLGCRRERDPKVIEVWL